VLPITIALALLGLAIGSFAGVVAYRTGQGESWVTGRSHCDGCGAQISAYDNIPVLSWILLRGRCRACGARIPARYPLIEAALGAGFAAVYLVFRDDGALDVVLGCVFASVLAVITLTDLERRIIPNRIVAFGAAAGIALVAAIDPGNLPESLIAAAAGGGFLLIAAIAYPRGMGMGDVKLVAMMGIYLGSSIAPALLIGFAAGSIVGVALMLRDGAQARRTAIPFGPFLALGGVLGLLIGPDIVDWYTGSFFGG
jgi:leader peptidase (prepilin peptidase) / N-methyltransferase